MCSSSKMTFESLCRCATEALKPRRLSSFAVSGGVGAALQTNNGNTYVGVCIETQCGLGFCAEQAAASAMVTAGENQVTRIVAVKWDGEVIPPCGRCREFISQLHPCNVNAEVLVDSRVVVRLGELLPNAWKNFVKIDTLPC